MKDIKNYLINECIYNECIITEGHKIQYKKEIVYDLDFDKYLISDFNGGKFDWFKSKGELEDNVNVGSGGTTEISMTVKFNNKSSKVKLKISYENQDQQCDDLKISNSLEISEYEWYDILLYACDLSNGSWLVEDIKEDILKMIKNQISK